MHPRIVQVKLNLFIRQLPHETNGDSVQAFVSGPSLLIKFPEPIL